MTATATRERPKASAPPPPRAAPKHEDTREIVTFAGFKAELDQRAEEFAALLPSHIDKAKFEAAAIVAIKNKPELLCVDRRSLHIALNQAAEDGLLPDGREGVINVYKTKVDDKWVQAAKWIPMTWGIRKRLREVCAIIADAHVVCKNDHFLWRQGDDACIEHTPTALDKEPGEPIGAYVVFRRETDNVVLHREVMRAVTIAKIRAASKQPDGFLWKDWTDEAWKKTAVRRGVKSLPAVTSGQAVIERIVSRDDDQYDFERRGTPAGNVILPPRGAGVLMPPRMDDTAAQPPGEAEASQAEPEPKDDPAKAYLDSLLAQLAAAKTLKDIETLYGAEEQDMRQKLSLDQQQTVLDAYSAAEKRIIKAAGEE